MTAAAPPGVDLRRAAPFDRTTRLAALPGILRERIMVLDGAMGTMLQAYAFDETDFRGDRFRDHPRDLRGNSDVLCLTQPASVSAIHAAYLEAGAEILSTNSFTATRIAQADYGFDPTTVGELNVAAARLARAAADAAERVNPDRPRYVAGSLDSMAKQSWYWVIKKDATPKSDNFAISACRDRKAIARRCV